MRLGGVVEISGARHELLIERDLYRQQFLGIFEALDPRSKALSHAGS